MRTLANLRKAGPGETLTRWVKEPGRHAKPATTALMPITATGTRFKSRVIEPSAMASILVSGHSNVKLGRDVRKGALRGYWIYTLSLEERATCPSTCRFWTNCYGGSMPFAKRVVHGPEMEERLDAEITKLLSVRGRKGILIRLHALGDFYSTDYVGFWVQQLRKHPTLAIFGYTARQPGTPIGGAIDCAKDMFGQRFAIRFSDGGMEEDCTVAAVEGVAPKGSFLCPEQTGKTLACATCALCWSTTRNVAFKEH